MSNVLMKWTSLKERLNILSGLINGEYNDAAQQVAANLSETIENFSEHLSSYIEDVTSELDDLKDQISVGPIELPVEGIIREEIPVEPPEEIEEAIEPVEETV